MHNFYNMLNFKKLRREKKLNQNQFSELIGISPRALSSYENGNTDITLKKLKEISEILQVDLFQLFITEKDYNDYQNIEENQNNILQEPTENYIIANNLIEAQQETITILKREVEDLRNDKNIFAKIIEKKLL